MPAKWPLFLDFANSRLPFKKYPIFHKMGMCVAYVLVRSIGGADIMSCWYIVWYRISVVAHLWQPFPRNNIMFYWITWRDKGERGRKVLTQLTFSSSLPQSFSVVLRISALYLRISALRLPTVILFVSCYGVNDAFCRTCVKIVMIYFPSK